MKENIEEDLKYIHNTLNEMKIKNEDKFMSTVARLFREYTIERQENEARLELLEKIDDMYKRVIKENEELKKERDAIYSDYQDLGKEKWEADEAIIFLTERLENSISKQRVQDKIEEYLEYDKKYKTYTKDGKENFTMEYFKAKALQDLLEEKGK